jgi:prepilin-type N-terminal cleavage/methylation domain-containing protein
VSRRAFTLIELTVVLVILGLLGGVIGSVLANQQQFYRGADELIEARQGVRDALEVLSTDIRGTVAADTVRLLADSAVELFASIGGSVVCGGGATNVGLPGVLPATHSRLTTLLIQPDTGDLALFYTDTLVDGSNWERHRITSFSTRSLASELQHDLAQGELAVPRLEPVDLELDRDVSAAVGLAVEDLEV